MISNLLLLKMLCFFLIAASFFVTALVYRSEAKKTGGLGIGTFLLVSVVIYTLINPLAYLINPLFAIKYFLYLGELGVKQIFPSVLAATLFIFSFSFVFILLPKEREQLNHETEPIGQSLVKKIVLVASILFFTGVAMFLWRNKVYFGSFLGSFNSPYSGSDARPPSGFASNYSSLLEWSVIIFSIVIFWQVAAEKWNKLLSLVPITIGVIFAVLEGNRVLVGTALFIWIGWHLLRSRITLKIVIFALVALTAMTLLANARYDRGLKPASTRALLILDPANFRPFWAGDPTGPNVVLTWEALHSENIKNVSWGLAYLNSAKAMVPSFVWPNRPDNPAIIFNNKFDGPGTGFINAPGTGYAYSMIAESVTNFWFFGPVLLGIFWALVVLKFIRWYSGADNGINRAVSALAMYFIVWFVVRNYFSVYLNPITLIGIFIFWYTLHRIRPAVVNWPFTKLSAAARLEKFNEVTKE